MRFFTLEWWCGEYDADPSDDYITHLRAIRDRLPADLLALQETISLHDSRLRELILFPAKELLRLRLDSHSGEEEIALEYRSVEVFESIADPTVGLGGPHGYGDLGYDEVDILPDGAFEHRLLFSTGIELRVAFRDFQLFRLAGPDSIRPTADPSDGHDDS